MAGLVPATHAVNAPLQKLVGHIAAWFDGTSPAMTVDGCVD
jgi:hypothetical protein